MKPLSLFLPTVALVVSLVGFSLAASAEPRAVGGITPDRRPEGLPVVSGAGSNPVGSADALHGVAVPPPASIGQWLDDQGSWFTPFSHPGMTGPYDIRKWHAKAKG